MARVEVRGVNDRTWESFKRFVENKYGKKHTVLGLEVERALRLYLERISEEQHTPTHKKKDKDTDDDEIKIRPGGFGSLINDENPLHKGSRTMYQLREAVKGNGMLESWDEGEPVPLIAVKRMIKRIAGYDERTVKKYLELLLDEFSLRIYRGYVVPS